MVAFLYIFWTISQILNYQNGGNLHICDAMDFNKSTLKVTGYCSFGSLLKFQNNRHLDFKMAAIFNILWSISSLLSYLENSNWWKHYVYNAKDYNKSTWKVIVSCFLAAILDFIMAAIFNIF